MQSRDLKNSILLTIKNTINRTNVEQPFVTIAKVAKPMQQLGHEVSFKQSLQSIITSIFSLLLCILHSVT